MERLHSLLCPPWATHSPYFHLPGADEQVLPEILSQCLREGGKGSRRLICPHFKMPSAYLCKAHEVGRAWGGVRSSFLYVCPSGLPPPSPSHITPIMQNDLHFQGKPGREILIPLIIYCGGNRVLVQVAVLAERTFSKPNGPLWLVPQRFPSSRLQLPPCTLL